MEPIRVLIVDDHEFFRAGLEFRLRVEDQITVVGQADNPSDALHLAKELKPSVIVLDLDMGEAHFGGIEIIATLRDSAKILVLSQHEEDAYVFGALNAGAHGYLFKRESSEVIIDAIRGVAKGEEFWLSRGVIARLKRGLRSPPVTLSPREREVLVLIAKGYSQVEIGEKLFIARNTVKNHTQNIYEKIGVRNAGAAASWAWKHGLMHGTD